MMSVIRDLGCLQLDPISVIAPSHRLVLWSRLGSYDLAVLDQLLWRDHRLFEYWAHAASIVLTEDYPIYRAFMGEHAGGGRVGAWMAANPGLRRSVLGQLRGRGPLRARDLEGDSEVAWQSSGWSSGRNVDRMLGSLWFRGEIMVAGRSGGQKLWDLRARVLPDDLLGDRISRPAAVRRAAEKSLRALGVATPIQITRHFTRGRYPGLASELHRLEKERRIVPIAVADGAARWPGAWYLHADDLPLLEAIEGGAWDPRDALLSPFDNLICDRLRTKRLFGFDFKVEIYVPPGKRRFGYYVLSVLHGDRLIGRIDAAFDRAAGRLVVRAIHAEAGIPMREVEAAVSAPLEELEAFLTATARRSRPSPSATRTSGSSRLRSSAILRRRSPIAAS
jgi:uncharacterized protein